MKPLLVSGSSGSGMGSLGRTIMLIGGALLVVGALLVLIERLGGHGGRLLPGDITIRKGSFTFYFPIVTCIVLSILLTLALYVVHFFRR